MFILMFRLLLIFAATTIPALAMQPNTTLSIDERTCNTCHRQKKPQQIIILACNERFCKHCLLERYAYNLAHNLQHICKHHVILTSDIINMLLAYPDAQNIINEAHQKKIAEDLRLEQERENQRCKQCSTKDSPKLGGRVLACGHHFCTNCLVVKYAHDKAFGIEPCCPMCEQPMFNEQTQLLERTLLNHKHFLSQFKFFKKGATSTDECCICGDEEKKADTILPCGHAMCLACMQTLFATSLASKRSQANCPFCRGTALKELEPSHRKQPLLRALECGGQFPEKKERAQMNEASKIQVQIEADRLFALRVNASWNIPHPRSRR